MLVSNYESQIDYKLLEDLDYETFVATPVLRKKLRLEVKNTCFEL